MANQALCVSFQISDFRFFFFNTKNRFWLYWIFLLISAYYDTWSNRERSEEFMATFRIKRYGYLLNIRRRDIKYGKGRLCYASHLSEDGLGGYIENKHSDFGHLCMNKNYQHDYEMRNKKIYFLR